MRSTWLIPGAALILLLPATARAQTTQTDSASATPDSVFEMVEVDEMPVLRNRAEVGPASAAANGGTEVGVSLRL